MGFVTLDRENKIHVDHRPPETGSATFVFFNAMGGSAAAWEQDIAPALRELGYGTLTFDYRGQGKSKFGPEASLDPAEINSDSLRVCEELEPARPVLVGNSIGGLFAAQTWLSGAPAEGLVLVNTLRKPGTLVEWVAELESRLIALGGMSLVHDVLRPTLVGPERLAEIRSTHLAEGSYQPLADDHPRRRLADGVPSADWDLPYEAIKLPTLILSGRHDRLFRVQEDVDELTARLPQAYSMEFADGGHALHMEFPQRFVRLLDRFAAEKLDGIYRSDMAAKSGDVWR